MNLLDNSYGHRYISFYVPPANYALSSGGNSMRQFVVRVVPERKSSGRSACGFITLELLCLVSLCGRAAYGQAPTGVALDESSLNTNLWTECTPDVSSTPATAPSATYILADFLEPVLMRQISRSHE
jgi:hypothetical protein